MRIFQCSLKSVLESNVSLFMVMNFVVVMWVYRNDSLWINLIFPSYLLGFHKMLPCMYRSLVDSIRTWEMHSIYGLWDPMHNTKLCLLLQTWTCSPICFFKYSSCYKMKIKQMEKGFRHAFYVVSDGGFKPARYYMPLRQVISLFFWCDAGNSCVC